MDWLRKLVRTRPILWLFIAILIGAFLLASPAFIAWTWIHTRFLHGAPPQAPDANQVVQNTPGATG